MHDLETAEHSDDTTSAAESLGTEIPGIGISGSVTTRDRGLKKAEVEGDRQGRDHGRDVESGPLFRHSVHRGRILGFLQQTASRTSGFRRTRLSEFPEEVSVDWLRGRSRQGEFVICYHARREMPTLETIEVLMIERPRSSDASVGACASREVFIGSPQSLRRVHLDRGACFEFDSGLFLSGIYPDGQRMSLLVPRACSAGLGVIGTLNGDELVPCAVGTA
jgi:hypothetical protein